MFWCAPLAPTSGFNQKTSESNNYNRSITPKRVMSFRDPFPLY